MSAGKPTGPAVTSTSAVDLACLLFGVWTVMCHALVLVGGNVAGLRICVGSVLFLALAAAVLYTRRCGAVALLHLLVDTGPAMPSAERRQSVQGDDQTYQEQRREPPISEGGRLRWLRFTPALLSLLGLAVLGGYLRTQREDVLAWTAAPLCALALVWSFLSPRQPGAHAATHAGSWLGGWLGGWLGSWLGSWQGRRLRFVVGEWSLLPLAVATALFTLCANRPDTDEAFYLSVAAAMLREPATAILGADPVHGVPSWPLQLAVYRSHTLEVLAGFLAGLTGVRPIVWMHMVFAGLSGMLLPFAWMRLFRELIPERAVLCVWLTVVWLLADGGADQSYANFAMVRLFQGKAIMLSLAVPVVLAYGLRFARCPSGKRLILLLCAQAGGVGLSSIGIPLMPLLVGTALIAGLPSVRGFKRLLYGLCTTAYPLALGVLFYFQMKGGSVEQLAKAAATGARDVAAASEPLQDQARLLDATYARVLSLGDSRWVYLGALLLLPALGRTPVLRRLAAVSGLVFFGLLAHPAWVSLVSKHVFGESTYWRVFWLLPLPAFVVACGVSLALRLPAKGPEPLRASLAAGLLVLLACLTPEQPVFSPDNRIELGRPGIKVDRYYPLARRASELAPPGSTVAARPRIAGWLSAFEKPVYPVLAKRSYLRSRPRWKRERAVRCLVFGVRGCSKRLMRRQLDDLRIGVVLAEGRPRRARRKRGPERRRRAALEEAGFTLVERRRRVETWVRDQVPR